MLWLELEHCCMLTKVNKLYMKSILIYKFPYKTAVFYVNTNNGYTEFEDGTKVESVENRIIFFDGSRPHNSSTCTDQKIR